MSRLILFPGLGANEKLFEKIKTDFKDLVIPEWIAPASDESLADYSKRFFKNLKIKPQDSIGGISFGGQIALEMARVHKVKAVFLISSQRSSEETSPTFLFQEKILRNFPDKAVKAGLKNVGIGLFKKKEKLQEQEVQWLSDMIDDMDVSFFRWSSRVAAQWKYRFNPDDFSCPVHQIHGRNDFIIKIKEWPNVHYIEDGMHLINYSHPKEISSWIKKGLQA